MKNIYLNYIKIIALLALAFNVSCSDDFLEVTPKGLVVADTAIDYDLLLNNSSTWINFSAGHAEVLRSFEISGIEPYFSTDFPESRPQGRNFKWEPNADEQTNEVATDNWLTRHMRNVFIYNKIINEVLSSEGSDAQKKRIWAEARAARANLYFELVNLYGMPYDASTASTDLGFPLVTEADVTFTGFTRATVQEVYDFVIEDLTSSIDLLPIGVKEKPRMSRGAAQALLGKVYVYQSRYDEAITLFDEALSNVQSGLEVRLYDYNVSTIAGGPHAAGFFGPRQVWPVDNLEVVFTMSVNHPARSFRSSMLLSPEVSAMYEASDLRLNHFFSRKPSSSPSDFIVPGVYRQLGISIVERGIKLPDIYLLRAECKARTNDLGGAIEDLEFLRMHRMDPSNADVPVGLAQDDLIKYVFEERTREFALKGELWFDMRRLWNDPLFQDKKPYTHTLYDIDGAVKETFTLQEDRLVLRFSEQVMENNPDMVNNP